MKKTVFITGGSRGIGRSTALLFANKGYDVGLTYLNSKDEAEKLKKDIEKKGSICHIYRSDVSDYEQTKLAIDDFFNRTKKIDSLICNAGISPYGALNDMDIFEIKRAVDVNLIGVINACKAAMDYMISEKNGSIVNVSSIWGICGSSCESVYSATKGGIIAFSKALAKELGLSNIRVNAVSPGVVMTDMMKDFTKEDIEYLKQMSSMNMVSEPDDVAKTIYFLCDDDMAKCYSGQVLSPNCGILI